MTRCCPPALALPRLRSTIDASISRRAGRNVGRLAVSWLSAWFLCSTGVVQAASPAWIGPGNERLRDAVERLADERVIDIPLLSWPISHAELRNAVDGARRQGRLRPEFEATVATIEAALSPAARQWFIGAGDPSDLRTFENAPRESGELGARIPWSADTGEFAAVLEARVVADPADGQSLRPDGSYVTSRSGNWLVSAGWQDRWWGGGLDGSLELSSNARPVFALSLDRETSRPFETRWLRWLGPWSFGTFFGALEGHRPDSNHALLWGMRAAIRPLPGFEFSITRNAQFCGDKPPCGLSAFKDVFFGNDNAGENVAASREPGNQLATYEARWGGRIAGRPVSVYYQNTGETIDNKIPRPLRSLALLSLSTWGDLASGSRWRAHLEGTSTTCADNSYAQAADCAYENGIFTAGYRYRGRVLGHSTDSDTRQWVLGLSLDQGPRSWSARLRRAEVNRIGFVPQVNHLLSKGPQLWWVGEGLLKQRFAGGDLELSLGLEHRQDLLTDGTRLKPRGYVRWTGTF